MAAQGAEEKAPRVKVALEQVRGPRDWVLSVDVDGPLGHCHFRACAPYAASRSQWRALCDTHGSDAAGVNVHRDGLAYCHIGRHGDLVTFTSVVEAGDAAEAWWQIPAAALAGPLEVALNGADALGLEFARE